MSPPHGVDPAVHAAANNWMALHPKSKICPVCESDPPHWMVGVLSKLPLQGGGDYPVIPITCYKCGHVQFVDHAVAMAAPPAP